MRTRFRLLVSAVVLGAACVAAVGHASAAEWPASRQFLLAQPPAAPVAGSPEPSSVAEEPGGSLLVLMDWPVTRRTRNGIAVSDRTRVVRIAPDGSRAFVPPFGDGRVTVDDEILPLPDGSILFTRYNAIDRLRPNGSITRFAGTGRYSEASSGDGGPATAAGFETPHGLARFPDGSIAFAERSRIRRVAPDGIISTIAGSGEYGFAGDGGPATAAELGMPKDVLPEPDGGFLIADTYNGRVRRVDPRGVISTVAGTDKADIFQSFGDGGPAAAAGLALPEHLARLPDGSLLAGGWDRIRRIAPDGTISTIFRTQPVHGDREGDFAGRGGGTIEAMDVTREGGVAVITAGLRARALYLAPRHTRRTLIALRDTRVGRRGVAVTVDATKGGRLRLEVRRGGRVVAQATRRVGAGRHRIGVRGRFAAAYHDVRVVLSGARGGYRDDLRAFTSATLPDRLVVPALGSDVRACKRMGARRIDCEMHDSENEESGIPCLNTSAFRLFPSGLVFIRPYGPACHPKPIPFDRTPTWTGPWRAWPSR